MNNDPLDVSILGASFSVRPKTLLGSTFVATALFLSLTAYLVFLERPVAIDSGEQLAAVKMENELLRKKILDEQPWPPPIPSLLTVNQPSWLRRAGTLAGAYDYVKQQLHAGDFGAYYGLRAIRGDDGFVIFTQPERIGKSGEVSGDRWDLARRLKSPDGLFSWLWESFSWAPEGYYRVWVIAVSKRESAGLLGNFSPWEHLYGLSAIGNYESLPAEMGRRPLEDFRLHTYLYYYERSKLEEFPHQIVSPVPLANQLKNAGLNKLVQD